MTQVRRIASWLIWPCALALVACAQAPALRPEKLLADYEKGGYQPPERLETTEIYESWIDPVTERRVDAKAVTPTRAGTYPVVVFLPGLGDTVDEGALWTRAWARAGYFVLTVQSEESGRRVWGTLAARTGDFASIARAQFSSASLDRRLADAAFALSRAQALTRQGDTFFRAADYEHVAVAGFDLGAQTALGLAVRASRAPTGAPRIRGAIALSPYGSLARPGVDEDLAAIHVPVLVATTTQDSDPYGVMTSPSMRRAPFQYLRGADKFLLLLAQGGHDVLAGNMPPPLMAETRASPYSARVGGGMDGGGAPRSAGRRGDDDASPGEGDGGEPVRPMLDVARTSLRIQMRDAAFLQSVTTAFLDVAVKNDGVAKEWFSKDARRYLGEFAQLQSK